jgi:predicted RNA binding protein YcfA (HicA-like mRNA interferase family)
MPPLPRSTPRSEIIRKFRALGWDGPLQQSKYQWMVKGKRKQKIPNPHHGEEYGVRLLADILRQAGISRDEWNDA